MKLLKPENYQPEITRQFALVRSTLAAALPGNRVEHIGASAIPGAISKGDLDVCVIVPADEHQRVVGQLLALGYEEHQGTLRTDELCMLNSPQGMPDHAVQVVTEGSRFEFFLKFRDALRDDPRLVEEYNTVKLGAAHLANAEYRAAKSQFIERVLSDPTAPPSP